MKKNILFLLAALFIALPSFATTYTISVADFSFSPSGISAVHLGDTVKFVWMSGSHTTTSTTIPTGAATWDVPLASSGASYTYVPAVAGTYNYKCTPHASMGMTGSFTVIGGTNVGTIASGDGFNVFPNPASGVLHLGFAHSGEPVTITVTSLIGRQVLSRSYADVKDADINIQGIPDGIYIIQAQQGGMSYIRKVTIDN